MSEALEYLAGQGLQFLLTEAEKRGFESAKAELRVATALVDLEITNGSADIIINGQRQSFADFLIAEAVGAENAGEFFDVIRDEAIAAKNQYPI